jgi:hypothetical protein
MAVLFCTGCHHHTNTAFVPLEARTYGTDPRWPHAEGVARLCAARLVPHDDGTATVERGCGYATVSAFLRSFADHVIAEQPYSAAAQAQRDAQTDLFTHAERTAAQA